MVVHGEYLPDDWHQTMDAAALRRWWSATTGRYGTGKLRMPKMTRAQERDLFLLSAPADAAGDRFKAGKAAPKARKARTTATAADFALTA